MSVENKVEHLKIKSIISLINRFLQRLGIGCNDLFSPLKNINTMILWTVSFRTLFPILIFTKFKTQAQQTKWIQNRMQTCLYKLNFRKTVLSVHSNYWQD